MKETRKDGQPQRRFSELRRGHPVGHLSGKATKQELARPLLGRIDACIAGSQKVVLSALYANRAVEGQTWAPLSQEERDLSQFDCKPAQTSYAS
jgi:hypothetical protein